MSLFHCQASFLTRRPNTVHRMEATQHLQPRLMMALSSLYRSRPHHHVIPKLHRFYAHIPCPTAKIVMAIATARPATITVRTTAPAITKGPTTGQAVLLPLRSTRADDNHIDTITIDHSIAMNQRPVLILQTTIIHQQQVVQC